MTGVFVVSTTSAVQIYASSKGMSDLIYILQNTATNQYIFQGKIFWFDRSFFKAWGSSRVGQPLDCRFMHPGGSSVRSDLHFAAKSDWICIFREYLSLFWGQFAALQTKGRYPHYRFCFQLAGCHWTLVAFFNK